MPLPSPPWLGPALTVAGDLAAVALLTGYVHLVWTRRRTPLTPEAAAAVFQREHDAAAAQVLVLADGRTALLRTADGRLGVVAAHGRGWRTRVLARGDVRRLALKGVDARLVLRDYAQPELRLRFASAAARTDWLRPLEGAS